MSETQGSLLSKTPNRTIFGFTIPSLLIIPSMTIFLAIVSTTEFDGAQIMILFLSFLSNLIISKCEESKPIKV